MKLNTLATSVNWAFGLILGEDDVKAQAVAAARQYATWGTLRSIEGLPDADMMIDANLDVTASEWGLIKPLFMLYVERENARGLEASRAQGVEVFGRTVSEIASEITQYETSELPRLAFGCLPESI